MKVSELTGALLNCWVALADGVPLAHLNFGQVLYNGEPCTITPAGLSPVAFSPSTNWAHGGPIVEREKLYLRDPDPLARHVDSTLDNKWMAAKANHEKRVYEHQQYGETPLLAAMRTYVASKYGDEVPEVPA